MVRRRHCALPLQAVEQYEAIKEREREQLEELEAARRDARAAAEAFQAVQQRRHDAFAAAFMHVARQIDPIYKVGAGGGWRVVGVGGCRGGSAGAVPSHCSRMPLHSLPPSAHSHSINAPPPRPHPPMPRVQELTRSSAAAGGGGQAYLSQDSADEPYLGGIKYSAMPPTKRFRDMEQLSGGEKTVAALALLFAIHRCVGWGGVGGSGGWGVQ